MDAVIYTRVSKLRPGEQGRSTDDQEHEGRHWSKANNYPVDKVFCDKGISASRFTKQERPAWEECKAYLRPGHILVAWEASRTNRDMAEFLVMRDLCQQLGVPLAYSGRVIDFSNSEDSFVATLDAALSERESAKLSERTLRGKRSAAADGRPPGGRTPWGYRAVGHAQWDLDPIEAPRVREAVVRMLDGESQYSVLRWLQSTGTAPSSATNLKRAVCNPAIAGLRVYQGQIIRTTREGGEATWPAIITEAQHHQLIALCDRACNTPGPEPKHLLSGIALCGKCGEPLVHKNYASSRRSPVYVCRKWHTSRTAEQLDKAVEKAIFERLKNINPSDYDPEDPRIAEALREIGEIEDKLAEWTQAAINGEVTPATYAKVEKGMKQRIAALQPKTISSKRKLHIENWEEMTMREKRDAVRQLFTITVPPKRRGVRALPGDAIITRA